MDLGTVAEVDEDIGDWLRALDLDTEGDVAGNIADWLLSSDWLFDDNPDVGEVHGIEVTAQPEVLGNNKRVTLSPRQQSEESRLEYFMKLVEEDIKDGDRLHADHQTSDAPVTHESFEPVPAVDDAGEEEFETQDMPNLAALWNW